MSNKVWFVTGASKGLGLALVKKLLAEGYRVAATSRSIKDLQKAVGAAHEAFLPLSVDVKDESSVEKGIQDTVSHFGSIDVVVNNAGYGLIGGLEELSDEEIRENFNINVFGSLNVIRKALPHMRKQQSGHFFNIASIGGFVGSYPGWGSYAASKFAVHGFTEALHAEVKPLNIKATVVSPGYFRTDFLASGSIITPKKEIDAYQLVRASQQQHQQDINHNQPGDPDKAAAVLIAVANQENPPLHLFLGKDAYQTAEAKIKAVQEDMEQVRALATSTDIAQ
jgi:NAD(P)-dependent dehydrogenase (short-subunit alcohol dehydrogenase family)